MRKRQLKKNLKKEQQRVKELEGYLSKIRKALDYSLNDIPIDQRQMTETGRRLYTANWKAFMISIGR